MVTDICHPFSVVCGGLCLRRCTRKGTESTGIKAREGSGRVDVGRRREVGMADETREGERNGEAIISVVRSEEMGRGSQARRHRS